MTEAERWQAACKRFARALKMMERMSNQDDEYSVLKTIEKRGIAAMRFGDLEDVEEAVKHPWRADW